MGIRSDIIKNLDKNIGELKSELMTSVNGETATDSLINEYFDFFSNSTSLIQQTITSEEDDNHQIMTSADILVLLNMQF